MISLLYIDDEPGLLELGKLFLESAGEFQVSTALSGDEGLRQLAEHDFDAIVSDFQMPLMDGIALLKEVRKSFGTIPFVLFTGRGREEVVIDAINNGVDFYLQKGGDPKSQFAELAHKVRQAVNRRRAEIALSDSEQRLADIINFLPDATFAIDNRGVVIAWNRAMERMTSFSAENVLGKGDYEYALPFYHERRPLLINLVLDKDSGIAEKYPFVKKEGRTLFSEITIPHFNEGRGAALWFTASPLYNRNGDVVGAIESIREISERKRAEESLVSANREYTNLLDQIQDIYYRSDMGGRLVRASRSWATLFGYNDLSECIGRNIADDFYFNPSDRKPLVEEIFRNGKITGREVLLKKKDGTPVLVEASSHLYFDPAGNIAGVEGTFRDITDRKKGEEELRAANEQLVASDEELQAQYNELAASEDRIRQSEQKYRTVFETTGTAMLMIEDDATISLVNAEFSRLSGYTREEIENRMRWTEFVVSEDRERMLAQHQLRRTDRDKALRRYEFRFLTRSGDIRDMYLAIDVVPGTKKSVASLLDVTDQKKAGDELLAANEQLAASREELQSQYDELVTTEARLRISETRLKYMLGFYEYAQKSEKELLEYAIEGAGIVTGSTLGYLAFLNDDESELSMYAWSKSAMAECAIREKPIVYKTEKTGLWGEAVRQRRPVITNDYAAPSPAKKGYPEGHPRIIRHMNVPVLDEGHIVLVAGVANKSSDYSENDVSELTLLMQGLWTILKRKRAEKIWKESEEKYRNIINHAPAGMHFYELKPDGSLVFTGSNPGADRILGVEHHQFIGKTIEEAFPPLVETEIPEQYRKVARDGGVWQTDHITYDGEAIHGAYAVTAFQTSPGAMVAMFMDITARKKAETELKAAYEQVTAAEEELREQYDSLAAAQAEISSRRQQLEEIASTVPGVVYQFYARSDGSMGMYYASNRTGDILGLGTDLERFFPEFTACVHPDDRPGFLASIDDAVQRRTDWHFEGRFTRHSGEMIWIEGTSSPVVHGNELVFTGVIRDISERKRMEEVIRESEERYRSLVELSPEAVVVHRDGKVLYANPEALRLVGAMAVADMIGRDVISFIHPDDRPMALEDFRLLYEEGKIIQLKEERLLRINGDPFTVEVTASPIQYQGRFSVLAVFRDVTERKRAEEALFESERKYRTLIETADEGIWMIDAGFATTFTNRKMQEIFGYRAEEMLGRPVWDFVPPEDVGSMKEVLLARRTGVPGRYERRWVRKDGIIVWCLTSATPLFSPEGEFLGSFGMFTDITERRQMEEALKTSEEEYRNILRTAMDGFCIVGTDGSFFDVNDAFCTSLGYTREEVLALSLPEIEVRETEEETVRHIKEIIGKGWDRFETRFRQKDGGIIDVEVSVVYSGTQGGRFVTFSRDITGRKQAVEALHESEAKFRAVIDQSFQFVGLMDTEGVLIEANRAALALIGFPESEVIGRPFWETPWWTHSPDLQEKLREAIRKAAAGETVRFEASHPDANGHFHFIDFSIKPVVDPTGKILFLIPEGRDITDRKRAEDELMRLKISTDRSSDEVFWMDFAGNILYVNDAACRITGYSREEFLKMKISDLDPDFIPEIWDAGVADLRERKTQFITTRHRRKDGVIIDVEIVAVYVNQYDQEYCFSYVRDITGRKRTEEALFSSQQMLQAVLDSIPQRVFWKDRNSVFLGCNKPLALDTGYADPADLVGKTDYDHASYATADLYRADDRQVMETGQPRINYEEPQIRPDGSQAWLRTTKVPLRNKEGAIIGVLGTYEDITEQKQAREALRESEEKYRTLVESSFDGIAIHQDGILVYVNRTAARILGSDDPGVFVGKPAIEVVAPAFRERITDRVQRGPERSQELIHEQFLKTDGTAIDVDVTSTPCTWKGKPAVYVTFRDITAQVRAEEALHESSRKYAELFELGSEALFLIDNETGALLETNSAACEMYGYPRDILLTMKNTDLSAEQEETRKVTTETPQGIVRVPLRFHRRRDGTVFPVEIIGRFFVWNGRPVHIAAIRDITEHKRAEAALVESEEKYRTLVEVNRDIIYSLSTDGTILYVSPQTLVQLGYQPDEMAGRNFIEFIHPDDTGTLVNHIQENFRAGTQVRSDQFRVRRKDGIYRWYEDNTIYTTDRQDRPIVVGTIRDITEGKAAQDALRESEEKYRALVETTSDFLWEVDTEGRYTYVSPQVRQILGYEPEELLGKTPFEIMPPGDVESIAAEFKRCVESRLPVTALENKAVRKDGSIVFLETSGVVRTANDGSYQGYRGIDRDITKRKATEEALRDSEERTRTILNTAQAGIVLVDADTHEIVDANKKALELIGLDRESVIGETCHHFICPAEEGKCPVTDLGQQVNTSERVLITATGEKIPVLKTVVPVSISGRSVLVESFVDISEQKRSEAAIREANRKLNLLNSITRHDIRNQLMVAAGYTQLASLAKPDTAVVDFLSKVTTAIETIQRQIEFTKEYQELGVHAPSWFRVGDVISSVRPEKIVLRNTCSAVEVFADPMIDKVFFNLFDNAVKYGERVTTVTVGCEEIDEYLVITFADDGCGIPPAEKQKIFEKGFGKNTGLGLFLAREILAITGITIHENGTYGEGSVFEIIIPKGAYRKPE